MVSGGRVMMVGGWEGFGTEGRDESGFGVSGFGGRRVR